MATTTHDVSYVFIELGLVIVGLAVLGRLASRWGFSAIPLYLLAGLAFGNGGLAPLRLSENFVRTGAEIGVLLLLFMLGLEYTGGELKKSLRLGVTAGVIDFALNFTPGLTAGFLAHWRPLAAVLLGGVTYISSSGVIAKVLAELRRMEKPETPLVLSVLVQEDLAMAVYLPLVAVLLTGGGAAKIALSVLVAIAVVSLVLLAAVRYGHRLSQLVAHESDEIILLTIFGAVLDAATSTIDHIAFEVALADFANEKERLEALGLHVETAEHAWVHWRSLYVTDPEGNQVELVCYDESI